MIKYLEKESVGLRTWIRYFRQWGNKLLCPRCQLDLAEENRRESETQARQSGGYLEPQLVERAKRVFEEQGSLTYSLKWTVGSLPILLPLPPDL